MFSIEDNSLVGGVRSMINVDKLSDSEALLLINEAEKQIDTEATQAQKIENKYRLGRLTLNGLNFALENARGSYRKGVDKDGKEWKTKMHNTYGFISKTEGRDGDSIDVFFGDFPVTGNIYIVNQAFNGKFDEHKVMYGFKSDVAAAQAYLSNFTPGWKGLQSIYEIPRDQFKNWVTSSKKMHPFHPSHIK